MAQAQHYATYYREMEVKTADPFELVLILYRGAISQLNKAKKYISEDNIEARVNAINRASAMIGELQAALDFERGGEIAVSLNRLYTYMLTRLSWANLKRDANAVDEIITLLSSLQSAWDEARKLQDEDTVPAPVSGPGQMPTTELGIVR